MKAVILAAGKGTRLGSEEEGIPKALRFVNNKPMIDYVLKELSFVKEIIIVVGYKKEKIYNYLKDGYSYAIQHEQLGTGHAIKCASEFFEDYDGPVLVTFADMPLLTGQTYEKVFDEYKKSIQSEDPAACVMLSAVLDKENFPYGRIIRDENNEYVTIVEDPDCTERQKKIREVFFGVMLFNGIELAKALKMLTNDNAQNEYYMTDLPKILIDRGHKVIVHTIYDEREIYGVNNPDDLETVENIMKERENK